MAQPHRIIVGMDLEESGDVALTEAVRLARSMPESELHPVFVIAGDEGLDTMAHLLAVGMEQLRARVQGIVDGLGAALRTRLHVRIGEPAKVLHQVAVDYDADVIVVGTHGRRGVERLLLGSVATDLVKTARLPVIVARTKDFSGLEKTEALDPARPGETLRDDRIISDLVVIGRRDSHISGLI